MLMQIKEGLQTLGVYEMMQSHPMKFQEIFTANGKQSFKIKAEDIIDETDVYYSPDGSNSKEIEINTFKSFTDFVLSLEGTGKNSYF